MQTGWRGAGGALALAALVGLSAVAGAYGAHARKTAVKKGAGKQPAANGSAAMIAQGKKFVEADGCTGCHKLNGKGGNTGPDLTHIGAKDAAAQIAAKVKNPKANNPNSVMPASRRPDKEIQAEAAYLASLK